MQAQQKNRAGISSEQRAYLKMIFDCFWPFRYPYPAFNWQQFPANEVFYPLVSLLNSADYATQDLLIGIFSELPTLDDSEIQPYLLPLALQWSNSPDAERRRQVTHALARMNHTAAYEALHRLLSDPDPVVRESAKSATGYMRKAQ
jgi:HEAT repeat protein